MKKEENKAFESKSYNLKGKLVIITLVILTIAYLILKLYFRIESISTISFFGLIIVIAGFYLIDKIFRIDFKKRHYVFIIIMAIVGIIMSFLYFKYPYFDKIQHFFFPMMYASMVYFMVSKLNIKKRYVLLFTFFIVVATSGLFEILEYLIDITLNWRLQGVFIQASSGQFITIMSRIDDTMWDMITALIGTLIYLISIFFLEKNK